MGKAHLVLAYVMFLQSQVAALPCICYEEVADNLKNPVVLEPFKDGTGRMAVVQQDGFIFTYDNSWDRSVFLNLSGVVKTDPSNPSNENGLRGLAFHPNFKHNRKLYVLYSRDSNKTGVDHVIIVSRMKTFKDNPDKVDVSKEMVILEVEQPDHKHIGGKLLFGDDEYLYIFVGDGTLDDNPNAGAEAQNISSLSGSILRIDVEQEPYGIPPDNPFVNVPNAMKEIYAYGFQNPWRGDVDEGDKVTKYGAGRIFACDVGVKTLEEINLIKSGENYGWRAKEGNICNENHLSECAALDDDTIPIHFYDNSFGSAVAGGHVYRGCLHPVLNGVYIYGDFVTGKIGALTEAIPTSNVWASEELETCNSTCTGNLSNQKGTFIIGFGENNQGEVFVMTTDVPFITNPSGKIYRIVVPSSAGQC